jgi:beta-galactosidase/beta-glucuronidase
MNGQEVGHNQGGHTRFQFNVAPYLNPGVNRLTLRVVDTQSPAQPRGKQSVTGKPHDIDYYCTTGIWQSVWLEPVPAIRIEQVKISPCAKENRLDLRVFLHAPFAPWRIEAEVLDQGQVVARTEKAASNATLDLCVTIPNARLWSPDSPQLYEIKLRLFQDSEILDEVCCYAGLRDLELIDGLLCLNGQPIYLKMVLDQGYWPQSYLTAPSDDALRADVEWVKRFGFNGARKHQKIEDPRWLYWCDRLGLLVWEEMPNAREWSPEAETKLAAEWKRAVERDYNHPCIMGWVPINESMGLPRLKESHPAQYAFLERMVEITRRIDATRPVIDNDGWEHSDITDICAIHDYTPTAHLLRERYRETTCGGELPAHVWIDDKPLFVLGSRYRGQPIVLSEVGGFLQIPEAIPPSERDLLFRFYGTWQAREEFLRKYADLMNGIASLRFVAGFCYTQLTDIEQETNGLLTYNRAPKLPPEEVAAIHQALFANAEGVMSQAASNCRGACRQDARCAAVRREAEYVK